MWNAILDALLDTAKLIPFLLITYLAMEYLEHRTGDKSADAVRKAGKFGPVLGSLLGVVPQCGFSAAAANLYAGRVITLGTLMSIYLSTSDEMLPILISEHAPIAVILKILAGKAVFGMAAGLLIDLIFRKEADEHEHIHELCEHDHCDCENHFVRSAIVHTVQITLFILLFSVCFNLLLLFVGEEAIAGIILDKPVIGPVLSALVGLIPNCAGSVAITQLYLKGMIGLGAAFGGLLTGTGVGLLILFRVNKHRKENLLILALLYAIGAVSGIILELIF